MANRRDKKSHAVAATDVQELLSCGPSAALPVHQNSTTAGTCGKSRWDKGDWGIQGSLEVCQGPSCETEPASPVRKTHLYSRLPQTTQFVDLRVLALAVWVAVGWSDLGAVTLQCCNLPARAGTLGVPVPGHGREWGWCGHEQQAGWCGWLQAGRAAPAHSLRCFAHPTAPKKLRNVSSISSWSKMEQFSFQLLMVLTGLRLCWKTAEQNGIFRVCCEDAEGSALPWLLVIAAQVGIPVWPRTVLAGVQQGNWKVALLTLKVH